MQCPTCRRELGDREPVYQVRRLPPPYPGIVHVCRKCEEERHKGWGSAAGRYLRTEPCDSCERPVVNLARLARRYRRSIIACSPACLKKIENARYRAKRYEHPTRRPCATCGQPFRPKRSDGLYCSPRCKQRAYRRRVTATPAATAARATAAVTATICRSLASPGAKQPRRKAVGALFLPGLASVS